MAFTTLRMGTAISIPARPQTFEGMLLTPHLLSRAGSLNCQPEGRVFRTGQSVLRLFLHAAWTRETTMPDTTTRDARRRQMICEHRREMQDDLQSRIRDARTRRPNDGHDDSERTEVDAQGDMRFALLEMRAETLARIDEALGRLDVGEYGTCFECGGDIADQRLRAAPFAVRCRACQQQHERNRGRTRQPAQQPSLSHFSNAVGC